MSGLPSIDADPMRGGTIDYDRYAPAYSGNRRADPRSAARVHAALGSSRTIVNVGAGAGSYEPRDRHVIAIEPSAGMRGQRPPELAPAIDACAEALPLDDDSVEGAEIAAMLCVIDREVDGAANLAREGLQLRSLFTMSQLKQASSTVSRS
jgi:hypothetical protein